MKKSILVMRLLMVLVLLVVALAAFKLAKPELYDRVSFQVLQTLHFKNDPAEVQRQAKINLLPISGEKKNILLDRRIFLDASEDMVKLALGEPKEELASQTTNDGKRYTYWKYHFAGDNRPTIFIFENAKFRSAYKSPSRLTEAAN